MKDLKIKQINAEETYKLRLEVLKTCGDYIYKYKGDFNDTTIHFGLFVGGVNAGILSLMNISNDKFNGNQIQLRGMAVSKKFQNKSLGKILVDNAKKYCLEKKASILWCNARANAVDFYNKQGFKIKGEPFNIINVGQHFVMYYEF